MLRTRPLAFAFAATLVIAGALAADVVRGPGGVAPSVRRQRQALDPGRVPPPPVPPPVLSGPCPRGSVQVVPGSSVQAVVDANPPGTTICLGTGAHRLQQISPKDGNTFVAEPLASLNGSRLLIGWVKDGGFWKVAGQAQQGRVVGVCQVGRSGCSYPEDLLVNNSVREHVTSKEQLGPGRWWFDYANDTIWLGEDPAGRVVETSVVPHAFIGGAHNVTIRGLIVEKYATPGQAAAIDGDHSPSGAWRVEGNEVRFNHGLGVKAHSGMRIVANRIHYNGQLGLGGRGDNVVVERNNISYNNTLGHSSYWEAGGMKLVRTRGAVVRANHAMGNAGPGLWTDIDNVHTLYEGNYVNGNREAGIFHEISYAAVIRNNVVVDNGPVTQWIFGGIAVAASPDVEIYSNLVSGNPNGITGMQERRGTGLYGPWEIRNLDVHHNTIVMDRGVTGLSEHMGDASYFTGRNNRFTANTYKLSGSAGYAWLGRKVDAATWRSYGNDVNGAWLA